MRVGELGGGVWGRRGGARPIQAREAIYRWKAERALAYATYRIDMKLIRLDEIYNSSMLLISVQYNMHVEVIQTLHP